MVAFLPPGGRTTTKQTKPARGSRRGEAGGGKPAAEPTHSSVRWCLDKMTTTELAGMTKKQKREKREASPSEDKDLLFARDLQLVLNGLRTSTEKLCVRPIYSPNERETKTQKQQPKLCPLSNVQRKRQQLRKLLKENPAEYLRQFQSVLSLKPGSYTTGQQVYSKLRGYCTWPAVVWSLSLCPVSVRQTLFELYEEGSVLVRTYGDKMFYWCNTSLIKVIYEPQQFDPEFSVDMRKAKSWAQMKGKYYLYTKLLADLKQSSNIPQAETERICQEQKSKLDPTDDLACSVCLEKCKLLFECQRCTSIFHPLCLDPSYFVQDEKEFEEEEKKKHPWTCRVCGFKNNAHSDVDDKLVRLGLTPDWIIHEAAFKVFDLEEPTLTKPYIKGLLDPCTNSKESPNIPAEVLYDKNDDGLKIENSWKGHHILLNPEYKATIQWRFVNRAIDEVENNNCPAIVLLCRNSTDTAYFHRLTPYPRILLRRTSIQFKDYDNTPIGFGIVLFCLANKMRKTYYERFYESFSQYGEINIPIDMQVIKQPLFYSLIDRLKWRAGKAQRDNWIQCTLCNKWRLVPFEQYLAAKNKEIWKCSDLSHLLELGCSASLSTFEEEAQKWDLYRVGSKSSKGSKNGKRSNSRNDRNNPLPKGAPRNTEESAAGERQKEKEKEREAEELQLKYILPLKRLYMDTNSVGKETESNKTGTGGSFTSLEIARIARISMMEKVAKGMGFFFSKDFIRANSSIVPGAVNTDEDSENSSTCFPGQKDLWVPSDSEPGPSKAEMLFQLKSASRESTTLFQEYQKSVYDLNQMKFKLEFAIAEREKDIQRQYVNYSFIKEKCDTLYANYMNAMRGSNAVEVVSNEEDMGIEWDEKK